MEGDLKKEREKPAKVVIRNISKYEPKCISCIKEEYEKANTVLDNKTMMYEMLIGISVAYSGLLSIFQIINAKVFLFFCKKFGNIVGEVFSMCFTKILDIETSSAGGTFLIQVFLFFLSIVIILGVLCCIVVFYVGPDWMRHWGTVAELVITLGIVINMDRQIWNLWHQDLLLIWLYSQVLYCIGAFIVWKKFIDN